VPELCHFGKQKEIPWTFRDVVLEEDGGVSWTDQVKKKVLHRVVEQRNSPPKIKKKV
jgi:hypothetical protein